VTSRTYLSIGDVLALLRQEFPDVTISKIRFLESQGLVDPERTPSGYRKFYEHDVERLRWVLRQQREHFLPLKVIKGRLEQEGDDLGDENGHDGAEDSEAVGQHEPALVGRGGSLGTARTGGTELPGFEARVASSPPRPADPSAAPAPRPTPDLARGRGLATPAGVAAGRAGPSRPLDTAPSARPASRSPASGPGGSVTSSGPAVPRAAPRGPGVKVAPATASAPAKGSGGPAPRRSDGAAGPRPGGVPEREVPGGAPTPLALSGTGMTAEELAAGSGLDTAAVEQLESYGLVCGRVVGGVAYYDEDALTVARMAAGLARYGVEARHLRLHKHAAEREAGFIEQIVLPLLKQRNPEARQRALEAVAELSTLGQGLREVLLRTALRDQLGG
jgi:DNA-binding transcriptional MerR regulator